MSAETTENNLAHESRLQAVHLPLIFRRDDPRTRRRRVYISIPLLPLPLPHDCGPLGPAIPTSGRTVTSISGNSTPARTHVHMRARTRTYTLRNAISQSPRDTREPRYRGYSISRQREIRERASREENQYLYQHQQSQVVFPFARAAFAPFPSPPSFAPAPRPFLTLPSLPPS